MTEKKKESTKKIVTQKNTSSKNISKIAVNFWRTKVHSQTMGIKKELSYEAKSRQYTKGFDIVGEVTFNEDKKGEKLKKQVVAINTLKWDENKRLLIRTFTELEDDKGGNFTGGIELSIMESINVSHIAKKNLPVFILVLPNFEYLTRVTKMKAIKGKKLFFPIFPEDPNSPVRFIRLESKVGFGDDFNVFEGKEKIAEIDDRKMDLGGKYEIKIISEECQSDRRFQQMIILISAMLKFLGDCETDIETILDKIKEESDIDSFKYIPDNQELLLFKNPRRLK